MWMKTFLLTIGNKIETVVRCETEKSSPKKIKKLINSFVSLHCSNFIIYLVIRTVHNEEHKLLQLILTSSIDTNNVCVNLHWIRMLFD